MEFVSAFAEIGKEDAAVAGGKGASLGEMTRAGIPVPPGFVILSNAFEQFLEETELNAEIDTVLHSVRPEEMHTVEDASAKIQALILGAKMPEDIALAVQEFYKKLDAQFVAVRSSATAEDSASAAWAGQLDTFLNTTEETLLTNVQKCWASLFTPRAIFYRFEKELHKTKISVAVVVQKMVQSEVSGIAFSVHPVTEDYNQLIIEAGFGLGEAIVSGSVTPDSYVVEKTPRRIIEKNITYQSRALWRAENGGNEWHELSQAEGNKPALTDEQAFELTEIILSIESHYGFPCDIEWAFEAGTFYITQSRPITTLSVNDGHAPTRYSKTYMRENCFLAFQVWEEHQTRTIAKVLGWVAEPSIFNVERGLAEVSYRDGTFDGFDTNIAAMLNKDPAFIKKTMGWYANILNHMERVWESKQPLSNKAEMFAFYEEALDAWCGLDISYEAPKMDVVTDEDKKLAMGMRERAADFLEEIDHVFQRTLHVLYPSLDDLIKYVRIEEVRGVETFPSREVLEERAQHFIYFRNEVLTGRTLDDFLKVNNFVISRDHVESSDVLIGQSAMKGSVRGKVRVLNRKSEIPLLLAGEILVTAMTTPDYLPAMHKAAAFVTDEGGITCHAVIVARELRKPCVIGAKFATQILKDGDLVEVDADNGVVRIIERAAAGREKEGLEFISPELKSFNPNDYNFVGQWKDFTFSSCFWVDCYRPELFTKLGLTSNDVGSMKLSGGYFFTKKSESENISHQIAKNIADADIAFFRNMIAVADEVFADGVSIGKSLGSEAPIVENFRKFIDTAQRMNFLWLLGAGPFLESAEEMLQESVVKESFPAEHVLDIIPEVITPLYHRHKELVELEREVRSKTLSELKSDVKLHERLKEQVEKYPWVEILNFMGERLTVERLYEQIEHMEDTPPKSKYVPIKSLSSELSFRADCLHDCGYVKQAGAEYFSIFSELVRPFLDAIAQKIGVNYREMMSLTPTEISQALRGELQSTELKTRILARVETQDGIMISQENGGMIFTERPEDIKLLLEKMVPRADKSMQEIKGQVGNPGKYTGPVKIIMNTSEFSKMKTGDVLVSTMTTPDFVILMQKAGAIVTDIGGMLCHAAIVSREINTPCVIGTKFATQILKDGDLVEVDADNGVVRIIERQKESIAEDILSTDWELWIRRKGIDIFSVSLFHIVEGELLFKILGGGTTRQLCVREGDDFLFARSTSDFAKMYADIAAFIRNQPIGYFQEVFAKAHSITKLSRILIQRVTRYSDAEIVANFINIVDDINTIILYNTSVPYFVLSALEIHTDIPASHRDFLTKESEKLRATSLYYDIVTSIYGRIFDALARHFKIEKKNVPHLSVEEMIDAIGDRAGLPDSSELTAREECVLWMDGAQNKTLFSYDRELREKILEKISPEHQLIKDADGHIFLKGSTAYAGKVSGVVRIVNSLAAMSKMAQGDILVAHTTNPSLMPAISLAAAIVTDEGGIASHAAIVAREMRKPCIIGTKFATQIFKDGDLVEVDADNGVVRIV